MLKKEAYLSILSLVFVIFSIPLAAPTYSSGQTLVRGCSISGKIFDKDGKPVKGALVVVYCLANNFNKEFTTGDDGSYFVTNLKPGRYGIFLLSEKSNGTRSKSKLLKSGQKAVVNFIPLKNAASLCGVVLNPEGEPIPDCLVWANNMFWVNKNIASHEDAIDSLNLTTRTDSEGTFNFVNLPPGTLDLTISTDGAVSSTPAGRVLLEKGVEKKIIIKISPGKVRGKVVLKGEKLFGTRKIYLLAKKKGDLSNAQWKVPPYADDSFEIRNLPPGSYEVTAYLRGYYSKPVFFNIQKDIEPKAIEILLLQGGTILFEIFDKEGKPMPRVSIFRLKSGKRSRLVDMEKISDGKFRVFSIEPGEHDFTLKLEGKKLTDLKVKVKEREENQVSIKL